MLKKRTTLSARLLGRSALTMATGMPTSHDSTTDRKAICGGQRPAPQDHVGDALGAEEGAAEIAARDVLHPAPVLQPQRIAEAERGHVVGALGLAELGEALRPEDGDQRIAGQDAHHHEHDDRDADDRQRTKDQTTQDVAEHLGPQIIRYIALPVPRIRMREVSPVMRAWCAIAASERSASGRSSAMEMAERVDAAHQRGAVGHAGGLAHAGGDVADGEPDPALVGRVRLRAVDQLDVVQRHLAGLELERDGLGLVDLDADLLAAAQQVVGGERILVRDDLGRMRARYDAHGPVLGLLSLSAIQAVTMSGGSRPQ